MSRNPVRCMAGEQSPIVTADDGNVFTRGESNSEAELLGCFSESYQAGVKTLNRLVPCEQATGRKTVRRYASSANALGVNPVDPQRIIELLDLEPLPQEGGFYRETYRAALTVGEDALPDCYEGLRNASTAIYFLLTPEENSALHILPTDEVFHFYAGYPVQMLLLSPNGCAETLVLGNDLEQGHRPQLVVPGGVWQGCRILGTGGYALLGCTVAPGFDFRDFHVATTSEIIELTQRYPNHQEEIRRLAPQQP